MKPVPLIARYCLRRTVPLACLLALAGCAAAAKSHAASAHTDRARQPVAVKTKPAGTADGYPSKRASLLTGVSCTGGACLAVGYYYEDAASAHPVVDTWTGAGWQPQAPAGLPSDASLDDVSCASSTACLAVGSLVLAWDGTSWRVVGGAGNPLSAASCAAGICLAVGQNSSDRPPYGRWTGQRWQAGALAAPRHRAQTVAAAGLSCTSASFCLAVGDYSYGAGAMPSPAYRDRTLAESWRGGAWHVLHTVNLGPSDEFSAVSCTAPDACTAVGSRARQFPLAERWNGVSWHVQHMPAPHGVGYTQLTAVSCRSATECMAVGNYQGLPLAYQWDGRSWQLEWLPQPPGDQHSAGLSGVSCAGLACMAVGDSGNGLSYAERWNGATWRLIATPARA